MNIAVANNKFTKAYDSEHAFHKVGQNHIPNGEGYIYNDLRCLL